MMPTVVKMPPKKLQPSNWRAAFFGPRIKEVTFSVVIFTLVVVVKGVVVVVVVVVVAVVVVVVVFLIASVVASVTGFIFIAVVELYEDKNT